MPGVAIKHCYGAATQQACLIQICANLKIHVIAPKISAIIYDAASVCHYISECLSRLEHDPLLISAVGTDAPGDMVMDRLRELEMVNTLVKYCYFCVTISKSI